MIRIAVTQTVAGVRLIAGDIRTVSARGVRELVHGFTILLYADLIRAVVAVIVAVSVVLTSVARPRRFVAIRSLRICATNLVANLATPARRTCFCAIAPIAIITIGVGSAIRNTDTASDSAQLGCACIPVVETCLVAVALAAR